MFEFKTFDPRANRPQLPSSQRPRSQGRNQQRMMVVALTLLLIALGFVLYHDRDFWFPDTQVAEDQAEVPAPAMTTPEQHASLPDSATATPAKKRQRRSRVRTKHSSAAALADPPAPAPAVTATRTVLPPLEVEVVAGDARRTLRPGTNSVHVDLQPPSPQQAVSDASPAIADGTAAGVTSNAAERVQMSADTAEVVSRQVNPGYPLLARQMKVQGSVILEALIGRDGLIQDLHVLSGPPILANAAREAVKQWHFKPHYLGAEAVETQAKITVNFTISTN